MLIVGSETCMQSLACFNSVLGRPNNLLHKQCGPGVRATMFVY